MKSLAPPGQRDTDTGGSGPYLGKPEDQTQTSLPDAGVGSEGGISTSMGEGRKGDRKRCRWELHQKTKQNPEGLVKVPQ